MSSESLALSLGRDHLVMVHCDPAAGRLRIERPRLSIRRGENVIWCFRGVPDGWTPVVFFGLGAPIPFESMARSPMVSWGLGAQPTGKAVSYRVALHHGGLPQLWMGGGTLVFSAPATLEVNEVVASRTLPTKVVFTVTQSEGALVVEPGSQPLHDGQVVEWQFDSSCFPGGDPQRGQPVVVFKEFEGEPGVPAPDLSFGPFEAIGTSPKLVVGSGNNGVVGFYRFQVFVLSQEQDQVVFASSPDPSIDNRDGIDG